MKTVFFITAFLLFSSLHAQVCDSRQIAGFTEAGTYTLSGTAKLEKYQNGSMILSFNSDFVASSGPNLYVYLATQNTSPSAGGNTSYEVGTLMATSGVQSYNIPATVDFDAFTYVLVHCKQFNSLWGGGQMATSSGSCSITSTIEPEIASNFHAFPNPVTGELNIRSQTGTNLTLYNTLGQVVWQKNEVLPLEQKDLSDFESGLYLLEYEHDGQRTVEKIRVQ